MRFAPHSSGSLIAVTSNAESVGSPRDEPTTYAYRLTEAGEEALRATE
jgi:hypothetical protein